MKLPRLTRRGKLLRNLALILALLTLYVIVNDRGLPPLTEGAFLREVCRDNLLEEVETLYRWEGRGQDGRRQVNFLLRAGDSLGYAYCRPKRLTYIGSGLGLTGSADLADDALCRADGGQLYLLCRDGPQAASAALTLTVRQRTYTLEGVRLTEEAFRFPLCQAEPELWDLLQGESLSQELPLTVELRDGSGGALRQLYFAMDRENLCQGAQD